MAFTANGSGPIASRASAASSGANHARSSPRTAARRLARRDRGGRGVRADRTPDARAAGRDPAADAAGRGRAPQAARSANDRARHPDPRSPIGEGPALDQAASSDRACRPAASGPGGCRGQRGRRPLQAPDRRWRHRSATARHTPGGALALVQGEGAARSGDAGDQGRHSSPLAVRGARVRLDKLLGREKWHQTGTGWSRAPSTTPTTALRRCSGSSRACQARPADRASCLR